MNSMTLYLGGESGPWRVTRMDVVKGAGLALVNGVAVVEAPDWPTVPCA